MEVIITLLFVIPTLLFGYWLYQRPTSLWTGFYFLYFLGGLTVIFFLVLEKFNRTIAIIIAVPAALILVATALFGIYAMIIALFWNERVLLKHERLSLGNLLPLILATGLILLEILLFLIGNKINNEWILKAFGFINLSALYFMLLFMLYTLTSILYNLFPITYKVDYIIILGAGLNKDKVTPLLAARIEAGVKLYYKQVKKWQHHPTIILSGGQGSDELISESLAMKHYIDDKNYQINNLYLEEQSTTTRENLLYSQQVACKKDAITGFQNKKVVVASNNYHLLRAGKIAKELDLNIRGTGAKTRLYYLPTAFIREYIGYLVMSKRMHIIMIICLFGISLLPFLLTLLINLIK
ncbi:YdcF family protein [Vagococcus intermedius]|uniref:YdcF family protein n=1 Tax=Vagococcus intermedius TaxID=2991418 RepID=A0AAF0CWT5_9ENTE|nr:YdcF family protein [Vagococcus intermedius]WEG74152.1 YdcF family protein [Vagococcus intermedius]WEG76232.1 YdcF family protein [Vagococcus intermedius]